MRRSTSHTRAALCTMAAAITLLASCGKPNPAIDVTIEIDPGVQSTCVVLVAKSGAGEEVTSPPIVRKERLEVAVYGSSKLSGETAFWVRGSYGANGCDEPLTLNDETAPVKETFAQNEVRHVVITVHPPTADLDADRDAFRAASQGGPDCDDTASSVHPGAVEVCADGRDNDCNGLADCADSTCRGSSCNDGQGCTIGDLCQADGGCAGTPLQCPAPGFACGTAACNPASGQCETTLLDAGSACDDGNPCTDGDLCLTDGGCRGSAATCSTPPGSCFAGTGTCSPDAGCVYRPLDAGVACNDGDSCTTNDRCAAGGVCSGSAVTCTTPPSQCFSTPGACVPDAGCVYSAASGAACNDGNACTANDLCDADGGCTSGTAFTCTNPPTVCFGAAGACLLDGGCGYTPLDAGTGCDDGNLCTLADRCTAGGACTGTAVTCTTPPGQCFSNPGACSTVDGGCVYTITTGQTCDDGNPCTANDSCQADGGCASGASYACSTPPSICFNAGGTCLGDGGCSYPVNTSMTYQACDAGAVCFADGGCVVPAFPYAPSNFNPAAIPLASITPSVSLNCAATFDSTPGAPTPFSWCGQPTPAIQVVTQDGGADAVVLAMYNFRIDTAGTLTVTGTRPVIFAIYDSAQVLGQVLATANFGVPGAGAAQATCGTSNGGLGTAAGGRAGGGGGAGFGTAGASGGAANSVASTIGAAGVSAGTASIIPLRGGCYGGAGGLAGSAAGLGGGGGGALQFSVAQSLVVSGTISTSGGGGRGAAGGSSGGGGAGSGGAVLLEASSMAIGSAARITANGGGGGKGAGSNPSASGSDGQNGAIASATPAPGGTVGTGQGGNGGDGAAGSTAAAVGAGGSQSGGGGGGAVGRIRLNGNGTCTVDAAAIISPAPSKQGCP